MLVKGVQAMGWTAPAVAAKFQAAMAEQQRERLAGRIRGRRKAKNWSAEELARRAGVSSQTISRLERSKIEDPRRDTIERIAAALDVDAEVLKPPSENFVEMQAAEQDQLDRIELGIAQILAYLEDKQLTDFFPLPAVPDGVIGEQPKPQARRRASR